MRNILCCLKGKVTNHSGVNPLTHRASSLKRYPHFIFGLCNRVFVFPYGIHVKLLVFCSVNVIQYHFDFFFFLNMLKIYVDDIIIIIIIIMNIIIIIITIWGM